MSRSASRPAKSGATKTPRPASSNAPRPRRFTATPGTTGTFLDTLPQGEAGDAPFVGANARTAWANTRSASELVTIFVRLVAIQPLRSQSLAGNSASAPRTDYLTIGGMERFWVLERKVRGVLRTFVSRYMRGATCTDRETRHGKGMCGSCFVCRLFGHFANGAQSRLVLSDFYSEQHYQPAVVGSLAVHSGNPFLRQRDMAPPGTAFLGMIQIKQPTKVDVGTVIAALQMAAMHEGFGSETTHYGRCDVEVLAITGGYLNRVASSVPLVEAVSAGRSPVEAVEQTLAAHTYEVPRVVGAEAARVAEQLARLSPIHPAFGDAL